MFRATHLISGGSGQQLFSWRIRNRGKRSRHAAEISCRPAAARPAQMTAQESASTSSMHLGLSRRCSVRISASFGCLTVFLI